MYTACNHDITTATLQFLYSMVYSDQGAGTSSIYSKGHTAKIEAVGNKRSHKVRD
ncbi:hypothetical protein D3C80_866930 [compost metagenome]